MSERSAGKKALIKVGYGCNENCTFCHTADVRHIDGSSAEVIAKIDRAKVLGHTMIVLSGGEPTIRPELFDWADRAVALGMDLGLVTNGLMLAYPEFVDRLVARRLAYVYMSLHGGSAPVHNRVVRADTFEAAHRALRNLSGRGLDFTVNTVVTRQNIEFLEPIVDMVLPYSDVTLKFSMVQPKGGGARAFDVLVPRVRDAAEQVRKAIVYGISRAGPRGPRFAHDGFPLCLLPNLEARYDDLKTHGFATMIEVGEPDFYPVDDKDKMKPEVCSGCALSGPCPGLFRAYEEVHGSSEVRPITGRRRSNSFNYVFETMVTAGTAGCPVFEQGVAPWDRGRHLFVANDRRIARFHTETRDFSDAEIEEIKHVHGQVYLDVSRKAAPDDFGRDLLKLERSSLCEPCPERARCTGLYEPVWEDAFARDDARVRAIVAGLSGDVMDVGCGEGVYEEILMPLAMAATIRYVGLDPDEKRVARLRQRRTWGELLVGEAEALDAVERFDHVLVLRSWNHLRDPDRALSAFTSALRRGGTLTIVDNQAYGLVRTVNGARRGEAGPSGFEHYRNDSAEHAHARARTLPLELVERRDAGRDTSNQWLLRYRRVVGPCADAVS